MDDSIHYPTVGSLSQRQCLPPGAFNLQGAPAFANFWTNTNSKRIKTMHNGKWKAPPKESSSLRFPDEHGGSGSLGEKGSLVFEQSSGHLLTVQMTGANLDPSASIRI